MLTVPAALGDQTRDASIGAISEQFRPDISRDGFRSHSLDDHGVRPSEFERIVADDHGAKFIIIARHPATPGTRVTPLCEHCAVFRSPPTSFNVFSVLSRARLLKQSIRHQRIAVLANLRGKLSSDTRDFILATRRDRAGCRSSDQDIQISMLDLQFVYGRFRSNWNTRLLLLRD